MKKRRAIKGSLSHHPLLPTGILMTVWRHPDSLEDEDIPELPAELEEYLHDLRNELEAKSKQIARLSSRLKRLETKTKRAPRRRKTV
jgi:hypothetical protein